MRIGSVFLLALWGGPVAGQVPVFEGPSTGPGIVRILEARPRGPLLREVHLLDIEVAGATRLEALDVGLPRVRADVPGASRVVLPGGNGSLYHYRRGPTSTFGFFLVEPTGAVRVLVERPGWGTDLRDPFVAGVAIDPAVTTLWVLTTLEAGGDLLEIDLASGTLVDRTATDDPQDWQPGGLGLYPGFGVAMTMDGPLRFDRQDGAAELVPLKPRPLWFAPDVVGSGNGTAFCFLAGSGPELTHVYYAQAAGSALRVSDSTTGLSSAGRSPGLSKGPWLALSTDGTTCAWIQQGDTRELFVRNVDFANAGVEHHVTEAARFADTLNDSGIIAFISPDALVALIGDDSGSSVPRIENADFYRVDLDPSQPLPEDLQVRNLSLTSGDASVPYLAYGTLSSSGSVCRLPASRGLLSYDDESRSILTVDWDGQIQTVLPGVLTLEELLPLGDDVVLHVRMARPGGAVSALYRLDTASGAVDELATLPVESASFAHVAVNTDQSLSAVGDFGPGQGWLGRIVFPGAATQLLTPHPLNYGDSLGFTSDGSIVVTVAFPTSTFYGLWTPVGGFLPIGIGSAGFFLPAL